MNQERAHQYCTTSRNGADNAWPLPPSCDFVSREAPGLVRAGDDAKRSIARVAFVQVQPDGHHFGHH